MVTRKMLILRECEKNIHKRVNAELIMRLNVLIEKLNHTQQNIARNLMIDDNYQIFEMTVNRSTDMYIHELKSGQKYHFVNFVKSKCNCG
jgi:hypothetical protein